MSRILVAYYSRSGNTLSRGPSLSVPPAVTDDPQSTLKTLSIVKPYPSFERCRFIKWKGEHKACGQSKELWREEG